MMAGASDMIEKSGVSRLLKAFSENRRLLEFYALLAQEVKRATDCDIALVAMLHPDNIIEYVGIAGEQAEDMLGMKARVSDSLLAEVFESHRPKLLSPGDNGDASAGGFTSALVAPILHDGECIGAIAAFHQSLNTAFRESDTDRLLAFCEFVPLAVSLDSLKRDASRHERELSLLSQIALELHASLFPSQVVEAVCRALADHLEAGIILLFLLDPDTGELTVASRRGDVSLPDRLPLDDVLALALAVRSGRTLLLPVPDDVPLPSFLPAGTRSVMVAPLLCEGRALGTIVVASSLPEVYTAGDQRSLATAAGQASVALANSLSRDESSERSREWSRVYRMSQRLAASNGDVEALQAVGVAALELLHSDAYVAYKLVAGRLEPVCAVGASDALACYAPVPPGGIPGWVYRFRSPWVSEEIASDPKNDSAPLPVTSASAIGVPIERGERCQGVLLALSDSPRRYTVGDIELFYTLANLAAVTIDQKSTGRR